MAISLDNYNSKYYDVFHFTDFISQTKFDSLYESSKSLYNLIENDVDSYIDTIRYNYSSTIDTLPIQGDYNVNDLPNNYSFKNWMENEVYPNVGGQVIPSMNVPDSHEEFILDLQKISHNVSQHYGNHKGKPEGVSAVVHCHGSWLSGHHDAADSSRLNVVLLYVTPYDIEGGELVVGNNDNKETIKPKFGTGVVINLGFEDEFTSPYHEVLPTTNGYRISTTTFYNK